VYLGIVEAESGSPRLSRDLIRDCNLDMRFLDSSVAVFAITSLGALFAVLGVQLLLLLHVHFRCQPSLLVNAFRGASFLHFQYGNCSR